MGFRWIFANRLLSELLTPELLKKNNEPSPEKQRTDYCLNS